MNNALYIYNSLSRCKQPFKPLNAPHVGMYVCGPTVYGDAHLGHARPAITFQFSIVAILVAASALRLQVSSWTSALSSTSPWVSMTTIAFK